MKGILLNLISVLFLAIGAGKLVGVPEAATAPIAPAAALELTGEPIVDLAEISGIWHSFPAGILMGINQAGDVQFGLDSDGHGIGLEADAWFSGNELHLVYIDYDGAALECRAAEGIYEVQMLPNGSLKFMAIADDCQVRRQLLSGDVELGAGPLFHPVND
jgi:hypothetical protein